MYLKIYSFVDFVLFLNFYKKLISVQVKNIYIKSSASQDRLLSQNMVDCNMFLFKKLFSKLY